MAIHFCIVVCIFCVTARSCERGSFCLILVSHHRVAPQLQVLQHVGVSCWGDPVLCGNVCHQLVGSSGHSAHRPRSLHLRQLQETR